MSQSGSNLTENKTGAFIVHYTGSHVLPEPLLLGKLWLVDTSHWPLHNGNNGFGLIEVIGIATGKKTAR